MNTVSVYLPQVISFKLQVREKRSFVRNKWLRSDFRQIQFGHIIDPSGFNLFGKIRLYVIMTIQTTRAMRFLINRILAGSLNAAKMERN